MLQFWKMGTGMVVAGGPFLSEKNEIQFSSFDWLTWRPSCEIDPACHPIAFFFSSFWWNFAVAKPAAVLVQICRARLSPMSSFCCSEVRWYNYGQRLQRLVWSCVTASILAGEWRAHDSQFRHFEQLIRGRNLGIGQYVKVFINGGRRGGLFRWQLRAYNGQIQGLFSCTKVTHVMYPYALDKYPEV